MEPQCFFESPHLESSDSGDSVYHNYGIQYTIGRGFNIPWEELYPVTVKGFQIPWVGGQNAIGRGFKILWEVSQ
jgi:hypothetical protein